MENDKNADTRDATADELAELLEVWACECDEDAKGEP